MVETRPARVREPRIGEDYDDTKGGNPASPGPTAGTHTRKHGPGDGRRSDPRVATFHLGEVAVLKVPLHDGAEMNALSPAEREVAALAAAGLDNLTIARCRGRAVRTVANQMASILSKLHVGSRRDLAARLAALRPRQRDRP